MPYAYTIHIQYKCKGFSESSVMNMRTYDRGEAVSNFVRDFGTKNYVIERVFTPTSEQIEKGVSLIAPVVNRPVQESKPLFCIRCIHSTFHDFAGYNHPVNDLSEEPLVSIYQCNLCGTKKEVWH